MLNKLFPSLFGRRENNYDELEIKFHKAANVYGEHGQIVVTHVKHGLVETAVRFVFVGVTTPPPLNRNIFNRIWEEARAQGYVPHHIATYGRDNEIVTTTALEQAEAATAALEVTATASAMPQVWRGPNGPTSTNAHPATVGNN